MSRHEGDTSSGDRRQDDPFGDFLGGLGVNQGEEPYKQIPDEEIEQARQSYPLEADLLRLAQERLDKSRAQAEGETVHEPEYHEIGWSMVIETTNGVVGLWNSWLGDRLFLGYPGEARVADSTIKQILQVEDAYPVDQVQATAVNDPNYEGEFKDSDKPLEVNEAGQIVAFRSTGKRQWAPFLGEEIADIDNGGRVWIDHTDGHSESLTFTYINEQGVEKEVSLGHNQSRTIATYAYSFANKYAYESPTTDKEVIQKYRDRFIRLAVEVARQVGEIQSVSIDYGQALVPEDLQREKYGEITWLAGGWGQRQGWGRDQVMAKKEGMVVYLKSGNSLVPWRTLVRYELTAEDRENLANVIIDDLLYF